MGFETFSCYDGDHTPATQYPGSSIRYDRWYWSDIEPIEDNINFNYIDNINHYNPYVRIKPWLASFFFG